MRTILVYFSVIMNEHMESPTGLQRTGGAEQRSVIRIRGARQHNLRNIDVEIPRNQLVVVTGPSGSGKSSFAVDTVFAEGQRQFLETLNTSTRQMLQQMPRPDVASIDDLPPTVCINQRRPASNRRSTVGTLSDTYDYLRVLMARVADVFCDQCGQPIRQFSISEIAERVESLGEGTRLMLLAPKVRDRPGSQAACFEEIAQSGLVRVRIDGRIHDLEDRPQLDSHQSHSIEAVVDRLIVRSGNRDRLIESLGLAAKLGQGVVIVHHPRTSGSGAASDNEAWIDSVYCTRLGCPDCGGGHFDIEPRSFSFNSPQGACPTCDGLGVLLPDENHEPSAQSERQQSELPQLNDRRSSICPDCRGHRLAPHAETVKLAGKCIFEMTELTIDDASEFFGSLTLSDRQMQIGRLALAEIQQRLDYLRAVGLGYLTLDRRTDTLSGGELQRVRLASSIGSALSGVCYILDEPTIGMHPRDTRRIIQTIRDLVQGGNSLIVVEHDLQMIQAADFLLEFGPGAGKLGGHLLCCGSVEDLLQCERSVTAPLLRNSPPSDPGNSDQASRTRETDAPPTPDDSLRIRQANVHNLVDLDVEIPLGKLVAITGVSGSGKSSLVDHVLQPNLQRAVRSRGDRPAPLNCAAIDVPQRIQRVVGIDQSAIGVNRRSTPATALQVFAEIGQVFAATRLARQRGYTASRFNFNSKPGACSRCRGLGVRHLDMKFLPEMVLPCDLCLGRRYNQQTLQVRYRDHSIADILEMPIESAAEFFHGFIKIEAPLQAMVDVGLGYLELGRPAPTLSGGESQRIRLAAELARPHYENVTAGSVVYLLDEPTTGLHFIDVERLLTLLKQLVLQQNSVIVVEHDVHLIRNTDWVIDLGPEAGPAGGSIVAAGPPRQLGQHPQSHTGRYLADAASVGRDRPTKPEIQNTKHQT